MNTVWKFLILVVCLYAGVTALIYFRQSSLIYYPNAAGRILTATPQHIGLAFEDVELVTEDKVGLHGWFIPSENARATLLFFHGNAGNISHRLDSIAIFNRMRLNVFIFDYRGYGQSQGRVTETGTYRDAEAAWSYLIETRGIDASKIIVFGRSLGSSIAAWLARQHRPAALILESSFSSVPSMAQRLYPFLPVKWLATFSYETSPARCSWCTVKTIQLSPTPRAVSFSMRHRQTSNSSIFAVGTTTASSSPAGLMSMD